MLHVRHLIAVTGEEEQIGDGVLDEEAKEEEEEKDIKVTLQMCGHNGRGRGGR